MIIIKGTGSKRTISISKIRKITARRKNRSEKGIRADLLGSKPHSNGEFFSRSKDNFFEIANETVRRTRIRKIEITEDNIISIITKTGYVLVIKYEIIRVG